MRTKYWHYRLCEPEDVLKLESLWQPYIKQLHRFGIWLTDSTIPEEKTMTFIIKPVVIWGEFIRNARIVRIGITQSPDWLNWEDYVREKNIDDQERERFQEIHHIEYVRQANWFFSDKSIPKSQWECIEVFEDGKWNRIWDYVEVVAKRPPDATDDKEDDG